jgi:hypothetical protein
LCGEDTRRQNESESKRQHDKLPHNSSVRCVLKEEETTKGAKSTSNSFSHELNECNEWARPNVIYRAHSLHSFNSWLKKFSSAPT